MTERGQTSRTTEEPPPAKEKADAPEPYVINSTGQSREICNPNYKAKGAAPEESDARSGKPQRVLNQCLEKPNLHVSLLEALLGFFYGEEARPCDSSRRAKDFSYYLFLQERSLRLDDLNKVAHEMWRKYAIDAILVGPNLGDMKVVIAPAMGGRSRNRLVCVFLHKKNQSGNAKIVLVVMDDQKEDGRVSKKIDLPASETDAAVRVLDDLIGYLLQHFQYPFNNSHMYEFLTNWLTIDISQERYIDISMSHQS